MLSVFLLRGAPNAAAVLLRSDEAYVGGLLLAFGLIATLVQLIAGTTPATS